MRTKANTLIMGVVHQPVRGLAKYGGMTRRQMEGLLVMFNGKFFRGLNRFLTKDYGKVVEIAEMLFRIDPVNEIAIAMLVKALVRQRRHEDARIRYRSFCEVWRSAYETDYHITFDTLCSDARTVRK